MKTRIQKTGIIKWLVLSVAFALVNVFLFIAVTNPLSIKADEVAANTGALNLFVGFIFASTFLFWIAGEEFKAVATAVSTNDKETFLREAPKRIHLGYWIFYGAIVGFTILSLHQFKIESPMVIFVMEFGIPFVIATALLVIVDMDDPITGVISVAGIKKEWIDELERRDEK